MLRYYGQRVGVVQPGPDDVAKLGIYCGVDFGRHVGSEALFYFFVRPFLKCNLTGFYPILTREAVDNGVWQIELLSPMFSGVWGG